MKTFHVLFLPIVSVSAVSVTKGSYHEQHCPLHEFPTTKKVDSEVCPSAISWKEKTNAVESVPEIDRTYFVQRPTKGQRLILVPRDSDLTVRLDDHVAYQLRQRQQLHNVKSDDLMSATLKTTGRMIVSQISDDIIQQLLIQNGDDNQTTTDRTFGAKKLPLNDDLVPLLLKSHPGQALVPLQSSPISGGFMLEQMNYVDIGIGSVNDAIHIRLNEPQVVSKRDDAIGDSFRYTLTDANGLVVLVGSSQLKVGSPVTMTSYLNDGVDVEEIFSLLAMDYFYRSSFVINNDGSISPYEAQHLTIGISRFPAVTLIERFSPNRLIFERVDTFWKPPAPVNGTALVLKSHPGLAVVTYPRYPGAFGLVDVMDILIGPANDQMYRTFHLFPRDNFRHHEFSLRDKYAARLIPMNLKLELDVPIRTIMYNVSEVVDTALWLLLSIERNATWTINLEGSISPLQAPHLVLGCNYISEFVDREVATTQRLMWQSNIVPNDTTARSDQKTISQSTDNENRIVHGIVWFLFREGYFRYVMLIVAVVILIVIKLIPLPIWIMLVLQLTLGTTVCMIYAGYNIGFIVTQTLFKRLKKQNIPEVIPVH